MSKVPEKCPTCGADWDGGRYYKCGSWLQVSGHLRQAASCRVKELEDAFGAGNLIAGIFELCGIKETWTQPEIGKWVSDQVELRNNLRELVQLIKNRVVQNVHDNQKMESATEFIKMWIEFKKNEVG